MRSIVTSYAGFVPIVCALAACSSGPGSEDLGQSASPLIIPKCPPGYSLDCSGDRPQGQTICTCVQNAATYPLPVQVTGLTTQGLVLMESSVTSTQYPVASSGSFTQIGRSCSVNGRPMTPRRGIMSPARALARSRHQGRPIRPKQKLPLPVPSGPPKETLAASAQAHREAAFRDVQQGYFHDASDELDIAQLMDPAGEQDPRVKQARYDILHGAPRLMRDAKQGLEFWEVPDYKPRPVQR